MNPRALLAILLAIGLAAWVVSVHWNGLFWVIGGTTAVCLFFPELPGRVVEWWER